ncbi:UPF0483 protein [Durusdinium trenchii]|uniref:UPF0483 protein n=1 Tax=Durusdinium trenchii TaxID=1381693 RepID=A0ABP0PMK1_9DINO
MPPQLWEVVGGVEQGGILVRQGCELSSPAEAERLSTGALIMADLSQKKEMEERLKYWLVSGTGPPCGWISMRVKGKPLVEARSPSRRLRVLALHGAPGNSNIMNFQTAGLRKMAGEDFEWSFLDGPCAWEPVPNSTQMNLAERTAIEKALAKGKPFVQWYSHPKPTGEEEGQEPAKAMSFENVVYENVEEGIKFLQTALAGLDPDIVLCYSQSGTMLAMYMDVMRKDRLVSTPVPWRLGVFFCGAMIDDPRYQLREPLPLPAVYIHGGDADPWGRHGEKMLPKMYKDWRMLLRFILESFRSPHHARSGHGCLNFETCWSTSI